MTNYTPNQSQEPLEVYYLVKVKQNSIGHHKIQWFLNESRMPYRTTVSDDHITALNDLMDQPEFTSRLSAFLDQSLSDFMEKVLKGEPS